MKNKSLGMNSKGKVQQLTERINFSIKKIQIWLGFDGSNRSKPRTDTVQNWRNKTVVT